MINCVHHWVLEPPENTAIGGTCKKCGAKRIFRPFADEDLKGMAASTRANNAGAASRPQIAATWVSGPVLRKTRNRDRSGERGRNR